MKKYLLLILCLVNLRGFSEESLMKMNIRKSHARGHADHGWLNTYHTFSFGDYYDAKFMGFRALRVINEDTVAPGRGFATHPHNNMEILTIILEGELAHKDSMGTGSTIKVGEVQLMSAGSGITHSEFNASSQKPVHLLQIWIEPDKKDLKPGYQQITLSDAKMRNNLLLIASKNPIDQAMRIHQDADIYLGMLSKESTLEHSLAKERYGWIQVAQGTILVDGQELKAGDGAALEDVGKLSIKAMTDAKIVLFDLR